MKYVNIAKPVMNKLLLFCLLLLFFCCTDRQCETESKAVYTKSIITTFNIPNSYQPARFRVKGIDDDFIVFDNANFEVVSGENEDGAPILWFEFSPYAWEDNRYRAGQYRKWYSSEASLDTLKSEIIEKINKNNNVPKIDFKTDLLRIEIGKNVKDSCIAAKVYFTSLSLYPPGRVIEYSERKYYSDFFYELKYWFPDEAEFRNEQFIDCLFEQGVVGQISGLPDKWN